MGMTPQQQAEAIAKALKTYLFDKIGATEEQMAPAIERQLNVLRQNGAFLQDYPQCKDCRHHNAKNHECDNPKLRSAEEDGLLTRAVVGYSADSIASEAVYPSVGQKFGCRHHETVSSNTAPTPAA